MTSRSCDLAITWPQDSLSKSRITRCHNLVVPFLVSGFGFSLLPWNKVTPKSSDLPIMWPHDHKTSRFFFKKWVTWCYNLHVLCLIADLGFLRFHEIKSLPSHVTSLSRDLMITWPFNHFWSHDLAILSKSWVSSRHISSFSLCQRIGVSRFR